jgi:hypothetical protein
MEQAWANYEASAGGTIEHVAGPPIDNEGVPYVRQR